MRYKNRKCTVSRGLKSWRLVANLPPLLLDHCAWTGKLQGASKHFNECEYAGATCKFDRCGLVVMRKDMPKHEASCPRRTQPCKWCQLMLRVDGPLIEHESACEEREVECTHAHLGCTAVMRFDMRDQHTANECPFETVACPFSPAGCNERMMRKDIENHEIAAMKQHNRLLMQNIQSLQQKAAEQADSIQSLNRDKQNLQQKIVNQDATIGNQGKKAIEQAQSLQRDIQVLHQKMALTKNGIASEAPLHELVFKVKVADLVRDGEVHKKSLSKMVGPYMTSMYVRKGYADNGENCGVHLHIEDGPFPCYVSCTLEVVYWDGKTESALKGDFICTYEQATGYGFTQFIPLSKITAAASPYVRDDKVAEMEMTCPQQHQLARVTRPWRAICDVCEKSANHNGSTRNSCCRGCDYDICDECARVTNHMKGTTGKYYCGRRLGVSAIPGSDGQCGPNDGPQCKGCLAFFPAFVTFIATFRIVGQYGGEQ